MKQQETIAGKADGVQVKWYSDDWSTQCSEDSKELIDLRVAGKERLCGDEFGEYAADAPDVDRGRVDLVA